MKETGVLTIKLLVITAVVAALLGAVNLVTSPIIAKNTEATFNATMKELLPEAEKFELDGTKLPDFESTVKVDGVYCGTNGDGEVVGYVTSAVCSEGYGGDVTVMVGVDADCHVTRAKVTAMSETPGLGAKSQSDWINQYSGLGQNIEVDKNGSAKSDNKIEAISGATITSKAVTKAVNASLDAVKVVIDDNSGVIAEEVIDDEVVYDEEGNIVMPESQTEEEAEALNPDDVTKESTNTEDVQKEVVAETGGDTNE